MTPKNRPTIRWIAYGVYLLLLSFSPAGAFQIDTILKDRPRGKELVFDHAHILPDALDYSRDYLAGIRDRYRIEAFLVTVPEMGADRTIEMLAVELHERWQIGRPFDGRGILLLLDDQTKQVKLEVSQELEDVFTDAFCGYIQDLQLRPYFLSGQLGTGLLAVMEEIEHRAQIKRQGEYTRQSIAGLDQRLLSQGAGAARDLRRFAAEDIPSPGGRYPAGRTPAEAWETLLRSWREKARDPNLGVYSAVTRLTYRDYRNLPDSRYEKDVRTYAGKPYEVIEKGDAAVIFFGAREGWDNAPFLFCRTREGWQCDIVHQRKYIRMGKDPAWGVERGDHPYIGLLEKCPYFQGQDIPLEAPDVYRIAEDGSMAERILAAEARLQEAPADPAALMELGRLYTIVSMGQKALPLLKKAKTVDPAAALPYKYLAILHVDMFYQYEQAIQELTEYVARRPEDVFGRNYLGYLHYQMRRYPEAVDQLRKALALRADNCYALCMLSRAYGQMALAAWRIDPRRPWYRKSSLEMLQKAAAVETPNPRRVAWLKDWLKRHKILGQDG
jgi:tetratricopeptide (TPR) repeat protein